MGEVHYMISEAAKRVNVETHVLRYWEEELDLEIGRTEMGHRYYTEEDVRLFHCIKELKEQGMLLKDLKDLIPDMVRTRAKRLADKPCAAEHPEKLTELQLALLENNKILKEAITKSVTKEIGYLFTANERQEEARYQKLDTLIRQQQTYRKEAAKTNSFPSFKRLFQT